MIYTISGIVLKLKEGASQISLAIICTEPDNFGAQGDGQTDQLCDLAEQ
jgi:hypothetical protein